MWPGMLCWRVACLFTSLESYGCSLTKGYGGAATAPLLSMTLDAGVQEHYAHYSCSGQFTLLVGVELHLCAVIRVSGHIAVGFCSFALFVDLCFRKM